VHKALAGGGGAAAVVPLAAACCVSSALCGDAPAPTGATVVSKADRDNAPTAAKQLMTEFPFGVVMHRADISLAEAAHQFELARSPLTELRCIAQHIAGCISALHGARVVHRDVKPRNVVRTGRTWHLIDLDLAQTFDEARAALTAGRRPEGSSAFLPPEAHAEGEESNAALAALAPTQLDIWAFAATLFELVTGRPLVSSTLDSADEAGCAQLACWSGLTEADKRLVQRHGALHPITSPSL
jgi:serine/threonine protein kinase